jgi:hypothetical protein
MDAIILVVSWTLFMPPAHDVQIRTMPDLQSCLTKAATLTLQVTDLEEKGLAAKLVAHCVRVPVTASL